MQIQDYQNWVRTFYQMQGWYCYNPFIQVNFLSEEVGEVARAVRAIEIGRDRPDETEASYQEKRACLIEELGDVLDNLFILADKYDISIEEVIEKHQAKFIKRYVKDE
ncbi:MazG nucleotide pyrophosphohydrolase domain-containing protein [Actinobacillus lignieresii]|uniref:Pyrophosphatase n=1 Tax=Actinobacillus lignieresii TaxID=720 RepID=A0A380U4T1_ACTLI|nr:MazG-like family protein [Actinobacillus lignieresii]SUT96342.1 pyrophosphatase [Actinobacillus lignieresii]